MSTYGIQIFSAFGASTAISATSLANLAGASGYALPAVNNTALPCMVARVYFTITTGTNPIANGTIMFYLLQGDAFPPVFYTDAGTGTNPSTLYLGGIFTPATAQLVQVVQVSSTSSTTYKGSFIIRNPGPTWGIAVFNNTGAALYNNTSTTYFAINYIAETLSS
jgi:hypothetical protein